MDFLKSMDSTIWATIITVFGGIIIALIANRKKGNDKVQSSQSGGVQINSGDDTNVNAPVAGGNQTNVGNTTTTEAPVAGRDQHIGDTIIQNISVQAKFAPFQPLHQISPPDGDFIGREEELRELLDEAKQSGGHVHISGIRGMGGIGKTQLAYKLAESLKPQYPDAQIYMDLKGVAEDDQKPLKPEEALATIIRAFKPKEQLPDTVEELRPIFLSVLDNKKVILLMDNALGENQTEPLIPPNGSILLVTSRKNFTLPGIHPLDLNTLPEEKSIELLLKISKRIADHAEQIAKLCGYLPKALNVAGKAIAEHPDLAPEEYIEELKKNEGLEPVDRSLAASCKWLEEAERNYFYRLCVFPGSFDLRAAGAVLELDEKDVKKTLSNLVNISLIEWSQETKRYHLHDLTRVYARKQLKEHELHATQKHHAMHYLNILSEANALYMEGGDNMLSGLQLFDLERGNIESGQKWTSEHSATDETATQMCDKFPYIGVYIFELRQQTRERIQWLETALAASRKLKNRENEAAHLSHLGHAYDDLNDHEKSLDYSKQALKIARGMGNKSRETTVLINLGIAYWKLSQYQKAINYLERALEISREINDKKDEGDCLGNLGLAYNNLGDYQKAIDYYGQHLEIARGFGDKRGEGKMCWNMSLAMDELGDRDEAIALAQESLKIRKAIGDPNAEKVRKQLEEWGKET